MKQVNIYTMTSCKGVRKTDGKIAYILEMPTEGEPVTLSKTADVKSMTPNRAELVALIEALHRMKESCALTIYTESRYIASAFDKGWLVKWQDNGWQSSKGKEVACKEEWQHLQELLKKHVYTIKVGEAHEYRSWLTNEVRKDR